MRIRRRNAFLTVLLLAAACATPALAATINGTAGNDTLVGTSSADTIDGLAGNDSVMGRGGPDLVIGGYGNDIAAGDGGIDVVRGKTGHDWVLGGTLSGNTWSDSISGDELFAGDGDDVVFVSVGDSADCGPGEDIVVATQGLVPVATRMSRLSNRSTRPPGDAVVFHLENCERIIVSPGQVPDEILGRRIGP